MFGQGPYKQRLNWFFEDRVEKINARQCEARQRLAGDAKTQWKRRYQFARFLRRHASGTS